MKFAPRHRRTTVGSLLTEMMVALSILTLALLPLGYGYVREARLVRAACDRAVALEILDGEMEVLAAGAWRQTADGTHQYNVEAPAAGRLPAGRFVFTRNGRLGRLEWLPEKSIAGGPFVREARFPEARP